MRLWSPRAFGVGVSGARRRATLPKPGLVTSSSSSGSRAAGVNAFDPVVRAGFLKDFMEHRFPLTPGLDYAGTVEALGPGVSGFAVGDEVFGAVGKPYQGEGSFAEYVTAAAALAVHRPEALSAEAAAALPTAGGTALAAVDALEASAGDTVAIFGAAGGVGGFATQLAALRGLKVIAITRPEHDEYVLWLGATDVIDYTAGDVSEALRSKAPDGLAGIIDVFHDAQGLLALAPTVRAGGVIASPAAQGLEQAFAGQPVKGRAVRAATDRVGELAELAANGSLKVEVEVLPLDQAADAIHRQSTRGMRGKLVLAIGYADGRLARAGPAGRYWMMRWLTVALGATVVLLLFADFLSFHDLFEPHTGTDWIVLAASVLAVGCLALETGRSAEEAGLLTTTGEHRPGQHRVVRLGAPSGAGAAQTGP